MSIAWSIVSDQFMSKIISFVSAVLICSQFVMYSAIVGSWSLSTKLLVLGVSFGNLGPASKHPV